MTIEKKCRSNAPIYSLVYPDGVTVLIHGFCSCKGKDGKSESRVYVSYTDGDTTEFFNPKILDGWDENPAFMVNGEYYHLSDFERI